MTDKLFNIIKRITPEKWHWILEHEGYKRYFANTSWLFCGQMFSLLLSFFIGAWVARYLGPENYGILNYAIAFVGIFGFIATLGIDGILSRELVQTPEKRDELLGTAFRLKLLGGILAALLAVASVFIIKEDPLVKILVTLFSFSFIFQSLGVIGFYFNSVVNSKYNVRATIIANLISSILKIMIIILGKGVIWLVIVYALDLLWQGIGLIRAYNIFGLKIKNWIFKKNEARIMFKNSWPLMLASAASFIYLKIDQVMIGAMLGNHDVGIYAAAVKLVEVWYFVPGIICGSLFPAIINAKKTNEQLYNKRLKHLYVLLFSISILMAIPITLLAKPIIILLFGGSYITSVPILQIYIWSSVGLFVGWGMNQYLVSENFVKTIFALNLFAMIVNILLNLVLIPKFGIIGSAWATMISYAVAPIYILIFNKKNG